MKRISPIKPRNSASQKGLKMTHCDREDFDFHYTYKLYDGVLKKLKVVDEVVES
jgi:hypothetical protein